MKIIDGVVWLNKDEFTIRTGKKKCNIYIIEHNDKKRGKELRVKTIDGEKHIREDYLNIHEEQIEEVRDMYYKIRDDFSTDFAMARYFAKKYNVSPYAIANALSSFRFTKIYPKYHLWFKEYLKEKGK
ncbi:hypothetical protein [Campylobacter sputorum]|uniref:hypothetical protein n=1 Tax=Campylobacter sputorum TaxID=206 RepID=UPI00053BECCC|nr:hypothetical protein [Campylobacter sputorum]